MLFQYPQFRPWTASSLTRHALLSRLLFMILPSLVFAAEPAPPRTRVVESYGNLTILPSPAFQSFETEEGLALWQVRQGGAITLSPEVYKEGGKALRWSFSNGSRLSRSQFTAFSRLDEPRLGRLRMWVYNPRPIADVLRLRVGEAGELEAGQAHYEFTFGLNFKGWRTLWINRLDLWAQNPPYQGRLAPDTLEISAPSSVAEGTLYIDNFESDQQGSFDISTDRQMPYIDQGENSREYRISLQQPAPGSLAPLTAEDKAAFATIANRVDRFYFPETADYNQLSAEDPLRIRHDALQKTIAERIAAYDKLGLHRDADGRIKGTALYGPRDAQKPRYTSLERTWIGLLADWKLNRSTASLQRLFDLLEHVQEQGYADGSNAGFTGIDYIRMNGWAIAAYSLRHELAARGQLEPVIATMKWHTLFGLVYHYHPLDLTYAFETDYIRGALLFQLYAVLMMPDSPEKARDLRCFKSFVDQLAVPRSGLRGGIKPDYILFHHNTAYLGAYGLEALNVFGQLAYFLDGTPYAVAPETRHSIKQALLAYRNSSNKYSLHLGLYGRMPEIADPLLGLVGPYAYLGLMGDRDLARIFLDLWRPDDARVRSSFRQAINTINYFTTLGQIQLLKEARQRFTEAELSPSQPEGMWVYPYGSYAVHRRKTWMVSTRGLSMQSMNYEYGIDGYDQNPWGAYVNFGTTMVYYSGGNVASGIDTSKGWDWNRWPGATTLHLPLEVLKHTPHHFYGDEPFVGGVTHQGRDGIFALRLHDTADNPSFRATISRFFFGDSVLCLGSDIRNNDTVHHTETTLFQAASGSAANLPFYSNGPKPIDQPEFTQSFTTAAAAWLIDPYGTGYVIPDARDLRVQRGLNSSFNHLGVPSQGTTTTAWIDHGPAPEGKRYAYIIVPEATPSVLMEKIRNPEFQILQQDKDGHIVRLANNNTVAYALFNTPALLDFGNLKTVSSPVVLIESRPAPKRLKLSVADPDLRMGRTERYASRDITPAEVIPGKKLAITLTIRGLWRAEGTLPEGLQPLITREAANETSFTFDAIDGKTFELDLVAN